MYRTVGIISRPRREEIAAVVPPLMDWLRQRGIRVIVDSETSICVQQPDAHFKREELAAASDLLIVFGGDGTLLAAARSLSDRAVPILPINLGGLGFLTSVTFAELYAILDDVLADRCAASERTLLEAQVVRGEAKHAKYRALNDAVLNKGALARIVDLDLSVDGIFVCSYKADGLIISTPTGSTAYSLAAGGPIVQPTVSAFVITPICPHTLTNRPLVIPDSSVVDVTFRAGDAPIYLTLDGQVGVELKPTDQVVVRRSNLKLRLMNPPKKSYFEILRDKLKWGER
jgi:NAD+ kinase